MPINLIKEAKKAQKHAYVPYSGFRVGCALLLVDGQVIHGSNVENASYGLTNCAERSALFAAYSKGYKKSDILKMAVIGSSETIISPCGACRQVMQELLNEDVPIILLNQQEEQLVVENKTLLPFSFSNDFLK